MRGRDRVREAITILSGLPPPMKSPDISRAPKPQSLFQNVFARQPAWLADFSGAWKDDQC
jgi:hypothetical protein